jgi:anti-anti-sigma factor
MNRPQPVLFDGRAVPLSDRAVRLEVEGELDLGTAPQLDELLQRKLRVGNDVVVDLSKVTLMDSSGLNAIITAPRSTDSGGGGSMPLMSATVLRPSAASITARSLLSSSR